MKEEEKFFLKNGYETRLFTFELCQDQLPVRFETAEVLLGDSAIARLWKFHRALAEFQPDFVSVASGWMEVYLATRGLQIPYLIQHNSPVMLFNDRINELLYAFRYSAVLDQVRDAHIGAQQFFPRRAKLGFRRIFIEAWAMLHDRAIASAAEIVVLSRKTAWEVETLYGRKALVSKGFIDPEARNYQPRRDIRRELELAPGDILIFSLSRLTFAKRVDLLLKAFAVAHQQIPCIHLIIGGTGPEEEQLRKLAEDLGITSCVRFTGFIRNEALWDYYTACDMFASPAWADFNIAPYEALSFGKKVVCSSEMEIDSAMEASRLVFTGDPTPDAFADALLRAIGGEPGSSAGLEQYTWGEKFSSMISPFANAPTTEVVRQ